MTSVSVERGDIILSGLLRTSALLLAMAIFLFDAGAVVVNRVQLDEAARTAARAGAVAWSEQGSRHAVEAAVNRRLAGERGMALETLAVAGSQIAVTLARPAPVLLLDRIGPLSRHAQGRATSSSDARGF